MDFTLVTAKDIHAAPLAAFINNAYRGDSSRKGWTTEADLLDGTRTDVELISRVIDDKSSTLLLLLNDHTIVACVELRVEGHKTYLGMLTVDPEMQGQGLGKKMMSAAEDHAKKNGSRMIYMTVLTPRKELIAWYERHGYKNTGQTKPFAFDDPRYGQPKQSLEFVILTKKLG
jgi:ribosomal protein S18 acetylase RimI-like enzyme